MYDTVDRDYGIHTENDFSCASVDTITSYSEGKIHFIMSLGSDATPGIIAHESAHAAWRILEAAGFNPTVETQEPFTYLLEYIVEEVTKKMKL